jgi:hypothetical protein
MVLGTAAFWWLRRLDTYDGCKWLFGGYRPTARVRNIEKITFLILQNSIRLLKGPETSLPITY